MCAPPTQAQFAPTMVPVTAPELLADAGARAFVEPEAPEQAARGRESRGSCRSESARRPRVVPDAHFVDGAVEQSARLAAVTPPVEFSAVPIAACWMLSKRGVKLPTDSLASRTPSRYSRQVVPS